MGTFFYTMIGFTFFFVFLLGLYGVSQGLPDVTGPIQILSGPWPNFFIGSCSTAVFCVNQIGDFFSSFARILYTGLLKLGAVFALIYGIFTVLNQYSGFPYLGWFFNLLLFILGVEGYKLFRSGHTA